MLLNFPDFLRYAGDSTYGAILTNLKATIDPGRYASEHTHTERERERERWRQIDRQTDRQTNTHACTHISIS